MTTTTGTVLKLGFAVGAYEMAAITLEDGREDVIETDGAFKEDSYV